ncbi:MAG: FG-GAP repeat protein [Candidatus Eisenbacteria bacterium]|nr:FG-GAP repeat protein [Candidatus Eisenbacteria bacterium]
MHRFGPSSSPATTSRRALIGLPPLAPSIALAQVLALAVALAVATPRTADAHLSIIRQGHEVTGTHEAGDRFGASLAAGDFNGDGYEDLAIGVPREDVGSFIDAGSIIVTLGSPHGLDHQGSYILSAIHAGSIPQTGAQFGFALVAADFDDDGFDDLAVGVPYEDIGGVVNTGTVYFLEGTPNGLDQWRDLTPGQFGDPAETEDRYGWSLAAEDFDGDGWIDLAIGCPGENGNTGAVYYAPGTGIGPTAGPVFLPSTLGFQDETQGHFGHSLAIGNVLGDSRPDLVVGAPYRSSFGQPNAGEGFVIRGSSATGLRSTGAVSFNALINDTVQNGAAFATSVAVGNFVPGAYESIAIGEPRRWTSVESAGRVHVIAGGSSGLDTGSAYVFDSMMFGEPVGQYDEFGAVLLGGRFWNRNDGYDDLIIGSPSEGVSYGYTQILFGGSGGLGNSGGYSLYQNAIGEPLEPGDDFGWAFALGRFDGTSDVSLAIGAPGEDGDAGMVHDFAPWRQVLGLSCLSSIVTDCSGEIVFSQKPFDTRMIASTTKIMTVLLAAEHSQLSSGDPGYVALDEDYVVPDWVADDVPGSQVPLAEGETISFQNLMYSCLLRSGNDAAHAIADVIYGPGPPEETVPLFVAEMNQKAAALGMTGTHFHNPAGLDNEVVTDDLGDHYSTAYDMMLLSEFAMENPYFAQIAGARSWPMIRFYPTSAESWICNNIFGAVLNNMIQPASGIKGGGTPGAQATGCFSAEGNWGRVIAGTYYTPFTISDQRYIPDAGNLLALGISECFLDFNLGSYEDWAYWNVFENVTPMEGSTIHLTSEFFGSAEGIAFDLFPAPGSEQPAAESIQTLTHRADLSIDGGTSAEFGVGPFERCEGVRIRNQGEEIVFLSIHLPWDDSYDETLDPGDELILPGGGEPSGGVLWTIENTDPAGETATLEVEETFSWNVSIEPDGSSDPVWKIVLHRDPSIWRDDFDLAIEWTSSDFGTYHLVVHDEQVPASTPDLPIDAVQPGALASVRVAPNPFTGETAIRFSLREPADVAVDIFDAAGRRVRSLAEGRHPIGTGSLQWDGRGERGDAVPPGVYFYQVRTDGATAAGGKLVKVH